MKIRIATQDDLIKINQLLKENNLPYEDINLNKIKIFVLNIDNEICGCIGLEIYSKVALLRSFVVNESHRNNGYGKLIVEYAQEFAIRKSINTIYLLTTTAKEYFSKFNFSIIDKNNVDNQIKTTTEFQSLCPCSAICLKKELK